jgi:regulatory protein
MSARSCYDQAVALLAGRSHFRRQLQEKLARRGYPEDEIAETLTRLTEQGYLDDDRVTREFIQQRRGGEGARRVRAELVKRGAPAAAIASEIAALLPADDRAAALAAARSLPPRRQADGAAVARYLNRKGFSSHAILHALRELGAPEPDPDSDSPDL